jgi:hypothetical protein
MSPALVDCPKAAQQDPTRRIPATKAHRPDFITPPQKMLPLYIVLIPAQRLSREDSIRQTVVYRHLYAPEQYNRMPHKVVKDYLPGL